MNPLPHGAVWLVGLPGSGKTTLGRALARALGRRFEDLDDVVAEQAGCSIAELFREQGEAAFRRLEHEALQATAALGAPWPVVACGGGIVEAAENRAVLISQANVLWLDLPVEEALRRCRQGGRRPLLDDEDGYRRRLARRCVHYRQLATPVDAAGPPEQVLQRLLRAVGQGGN